MANDIRDSYRTLDAHYSHEIKVKGSRFIALGYPADTEETALAILDEIRKREHAATHHCFACTIGLDGAVFKYSDDGEPTGTAGRPIYQAITGKDLTNVLVIVVRYYGGTKLGTGGLTRAYSQAATELLDGAGIVERLICDRLKFTLPFPLYDRVMRLVSREGYRIVDQQFAENVVMEIEVRKSHTDRFIAQLTELSGGQIEVAVND
ncbi:MAG: IMPACT family protein [Candidatus Thorarchaeota archaeon]